MPYRTLLLTSVAALSLSVPAQGAAETISFARVDANGDNVISFRELRSVVGTSRTQAFFAGNDRDRSGGVSLAELFDDEDDYDDYDDDAYDRYDDDDDYDDHDDDDDDDDYDD